MWLFDWDVVIYGVKSCWKIKQWHDYCQRPEGGHLPRAARRFPRCGIFGKLTGSAPESREIPSAAQTVSTQCAPAPLTKMADWRQDVVSQAVWIKIGLFFVVVVVDKSMFKTLWDDSVPPCLPIPQPSTNWLHTSPPTPRTRMQTHTYTQTKNKQTNKQKNQPKTHA